MEGKNITIEIKETLGQAERLPQQARELVAQRPDVIVASSTPAAAAAQKATQTIPIVMTLVSNAVGMGFAKSLARPGGNLTGVSVNTVELSKKRVQLARELLPAATNIAVIWNAQNKANAAMLDEVGAAAREFKLQVTSLDFNGQDQLPGVLAKPLRAQVLLMMNDPVIFDQRERIARFASDNRVPAIATYPDEADSGALISYGPNIYEQYRKTALYVDRILRGMKPAELPIEDPTIYEFVVNLKIAKAMGLKIPDALMLRASRVIE